MERNDKAARDRERRPRSQLFTVRLWKEEMAGGSEHRGTARDLTSGAFRNFRDWSELVAFMIARLEEDENAQAGRAEVGTSWRIEDDPGMKGGASWPKKLQRSA